MLVLSRQRDETICIGDDIEVTVVDIRGDKVRIGVTAPRAISVHRKEVYQAILRERSNTTPLQPGDLALLGKLYTVAPQPFVDKPCGITSSKSEVPTKSFGVFPPV